ncbi:ComEA family DNA-binding protein [Desulfofustis glycolicus]|nr:helix-hairpin-helix domain-containing protein [Desulfofustis glycolicus]
MKQGDWQRFRCIVLLARLVVFLRTACLSVAMNQPSTSHRDARIPVLVIIVWATVLVSAISADMRYERAGTSVTPDPLVAQGNRLMLTGEPLPQCATAVPRLVALVCGKVPVNRAGEAVLQIVPGIGPELARRIVAERQRSGNFDSAEQLTRVSGIGPVRSRQFREFFLFDEPPREIDAHRKPRSCADRANCRR